MSNRNPPILDIILHHLWYWISLHELALILLNLLLILLAGFIIGLCEESQTILKEKGCKCLMLLVLKTIKSYLIRLVCILWKRHLIKKGSNNHRW